MSLIFCCPLSGWPFINYLCTAIIKIEGKQIRKSAYLSTGFNQGRAVTASQRFWKKKILLSWKILHLYTILGHCCKRPDLPSYQINLNPFYFSTLMESSRALLIYIKIYLLVNLNSSHFFPFSVPHFPAPSVISLQFEGLALEILQIKINASDNYQIKNNLTFIRIYDYNFPFLMKGGGKMRTFSLKRLIGFWSTVHFRQVVQLSAGLWLSDSLALQQTMCFHFFKGLSSP